MEWLGLRLRYNVGRGTMFDFTDSGVNEFEVLGIDPGLGLDPLNTTAFITALTFEGAEISPAP